MFGRSSWKVLGCAGGAALLGTLALSGASAAADSSASAAPAAQPAPATAGGAAPRGTLRLDVASLDKAFVAAIVQQFPADASTCSGSVEVTRKVPVVAGSGTGAYLGVSGTFVLTATLDEVDPVSASQPCDGTAAFLSQAIIVSGPGTILLGAAHAHQIAPVGRGDWMGRGASEKQKKRPRPGRGRSPRISGAGRVRALAWSFVQNRCAGSRR